MPLTVAPTLTTARLVLRGPEKRDLAPFTRWVTTSDRLGHLGGRGTAQDAWRGFLGGIGHWQWHGYGLFILEPKDGGEAIGRVGILNHEGWPEPELAWHLFDGAEGQGFACEAAVAVRRWAGEALGLGPLISMIAPDNTRSAALARRLGATPERDHDHEGKPAVIWRHLRHDAPEARAQAEALA